MPAPPLGLLLRALLSGLLLPAARLARRRLLPLLRRLAGRLRSPGLRRALLGCVLLLLGPRPPPHAATPAPPAPGR